MFEEILKEEIYRCERFKHTFTLTLLDIDHFKNVNDTYGHQTGDKVLIQIAHILKKKSRKADFVARFGGEEFVVLANNMNAKMAKYVFNKMREKISQQVFRDGDTEFSVTISCGVCTEPMETIDEMIKDADNKLYLAKNGGRNQVVL